MPIDAAWDDRSLTVETDTARTARFRLLQSWYRERHLGVPVGPRHRSLDAGDEDEVMVRVGSTFRRANVSRRPALNFLNETALGHACVRSRAVQTDGGTLDAYRLYHNMLSSMPLCFNVFGALRATPGLVEVVRRIDPEATGVEDVTCELTPSGGLEDRTAFDAFVTYRAGDHRRFLGVETKYTEPFGLKEYDTERYRAVSDDPTWFAPGAADHLLGTATNQLWRTLMLAAVTEQNRALGFERGRVVVLTTADDEAARAAVATARTALASPDRLTHLTLEDLVAAADATGDAPLRVWARDFRRRYLDLSPIGHAR
jgi:hypothetical protein